MAWNFGAVFSSISLYVFVWRSESRRRTSYELFRRSSLFLVHHRCLARMAYEMGQVFCFGRRLFVCLHMGRVFIPAWTPVFGTGPGYRSGGRSLHSFEPL